MTPQRQNAIQILHELRALLGIPQQSAESEELTTLNSLVYTLHGRRDLVPTDLVHRAEQAIADLRLEGGP